MKVASKEEILCGVIAFIIYIIIFLVFDYFAKQYDKKHPNEKRITGQYKTPKAGYSFTKGEFIYHRIFAFIITPIYIFIILSIWDKLF